MDTRNLRALWSLTVASCKMYFRNKAAVFFTMFIPLAFIAVFGLLSKSSGSSFSLALTNYSDTPAAQQLESTMKGIKAFKVEEMSEAEASDKLGKGKIDLKVVIPEDFPPGAVQTYYNEAKPQNGQAAGLILGQLVTKFNNQLTGAPELARVEQHGVQTNNLGSIDFLLPGILAISIMQLGIFSVAFAFVSMKSTGALRRLQATPTRPVNFVIAQSVTRLILGALQVLLLTGLGIWLFDFHLIGNFFEFMLVALLGTLVFLAIGFAIAGWAKDEHQAAPIANLISFPMMFLSGTFFPRDAFPDWLQRITDFFPLTFLADALRQISNEGVHLAALGTDLIGMTLWGAVLFALAVRVFRWE